MEGKMARMTRLPKSSSPRWPTRGTGRYGGSGPRSARSVWPRMLCAALGGGVYSSGSSRVPALLQSTWFGFGFGFGFGYG